MCSCVHSIENWIELYSVKNCHLCAFQRCSGARNPKISSSCWPKQNCGKREGLMCLACRVGCLYCASVTCSLEKYFVYWCALVPAIVINTIVEPSGSLQTAAVGTPSVSQTRPSSREKKPASKTRGAPSTANANESTRRPPRGPDGAHYMAWKGHCSTSG